MNICFLGTGTSQGVPVITCKCEVCRSKDARDTRLRTSVMIEVNQKVLVIDAGPDFRQQMLREKVQCLDAILFTHEHKDHIAGLDDIRAFNYKCQKAMDIYAEHRVNEALRREYAYVFSEHKYPGIPQMTLNEIENKTFFIDNQEVTPIRVMHLRLPIFGFRIHDFVYITDANKISEEEVEKLKGAKVLVINALRKEKHISHFSLSEALEIIEKVKPQKAYLTHISHALGLHEQVEQELPENVSLAYDGLKITIN